MAELAGRTALVTGAARGLGQSFCIALADAGAAVAGLDVAPLDRTANLLDARGPFHAVQADVTDSDALGPAIAGAVDGLGGLDILVANAGAYPTGAFEETTLDDWRALLRLNLDGTFLTVQAALPHLKRSDAGRIVVISSSTVWLGVPTMVAYVTTKMALIGFVRSLAAEVGEHGITVNAITPGLVETETTLGSSVGEMFDMVVGNQIVARRQQPEDLSSTLVYLCDPATSFVTGQTINVDGGYAKH